jgi:hypothetical protein
MDAHLWDEERRQLGSSIDLGHAAAGCSKKNPRTVAKEPRLSVVPGVACRAESNLKAYPQGMPQIGNRLEKRLEVLFAKQTH